MADIELIIKIPKEEYRWIMKSDETAFADIASKECMLHAIKNGTLLSKSQEMISKRDVLDALINKGQHSRRYKLSEEWELNLSEIVEALNNAEFKEKE